MDLEEMEDMLPTKSRASKVDPINLVYLAVAPPKFGKTTFFCDAPEGLLIAFERGFQFQKTPTVFIDCWDAKNFEPYTDEDDVLHMTMKQLQKTLEASDKYRFLTFDTADMAAKKCSDYFLTKHNWQHAQDGGEYGRGYDIVQNTPFRQMVGALMATGRGIAFTTHQQINVTDFKKGKKALKETTLPGGVFKFLHSQADIIFNGSYGIKQKGNKYRDRIWQTEGDEETLAGNRTRDLYLPSKYIIDPEKPWKQWEGFFTDPNLGAEAEAEVLGSRIKDEELEEAPIKKKKNLARR